MVVITKPGAQRRRLFQAPLNQRYRHFSAPLSAELKKSRGTNSLPIRAGDTVKVVRGDRKGIEGKVSKVDRKKFRISIEGITREKVDGTAIPVLIHPSKVMIINLNLDDKWRRKILDRKQKKAEAPQKLEGEEEVKKKEAQKPRTRKKVAEKKEEQEKNGSKRKIATEVEAEKKETAGE